MASSGEVTLAYMGTHEVLECLEGQSEIDLQRGYKSCKKNPDHKGFIPANKFSIEDLPDGYQKQDIYDLVKTQIDITVRIAVNFTSPDRPAFLPGTKNPYPCYKTRGQKALHIGTGRVWRDLRSKFPDRCPCPECEQPGTPRKDLWRFAVLTAKHVVFDLSEARQTSCRLWFDEDKSPKVFLYGWDVDGGNPQEDWCRLYCVTHDVKVAEKLDMMREKFDELCQRIREARFNHSYKDKEKELVDKLTIIVSHPHGCPKQVSIGTWVDKEIDEAVTFLESVATYRFTYTTCTCPASSGAFVYRLGNHLLSQHVHSGSRSKELNFSGVEVAEAYNFLK
ncbi:uncharacterized protein LOC131944257 [Physella acuta]|uniref:uncharacterized protein LOC131944257 n=1 Tax=Physella acuta TaxID=109671 RepID=UPI0027DC97D1|nr:uncharacterized protein LOC131944257 [Physella acuta]